MKIENIYSTLVFQFDQIKSEVVKNYKEITAVAIAALFLFIAIKALFYPKSSKIKSLDTPIESLPPKKIEKENGDIIEGEIKIINGELWGKGKITFANPHENDDIVSLKGIFKANKLNGPNGEKILVSGITYEGDFVNNKLEGKGKVSHFLYESEGNYVNDLLEGEGKKKSKLSGTILRGIFSQNHLVNAPNEGKLGLV